MQSRWKVGEEAKEHRVWLGESTEDGLNFFTVKNCLEGNTISNRGAYSTKERMPSDRELPPSLPAWKAVHNLLSHMTFLDVLPSRQHKDKSAQIPAHPRFTRMYGVTYSAVFQTILNMRDFGNQIVIC